MVSARELVVSFLDFAERCVSFHLQSFVWINEFSPAGSKVIEKLVVFFVSANNVEGGR